MGPLFLSHDDQRLYAVGWKNFTAALTELTFGWLSERTRHDAFKHCEGGTK
jgi:hypothetical protein